MAKFPPLTFTTAGTKMLVQAQNDHKLVFTAGKLGSGVLNENDDISKFTDLKAAKMTLPITKVDDSNPEKIVLEFDTSNTELDEGFVSRELGIFAKLDDGEETLYAYSNAGNNYDYIPNKDTPSDENRMVVNLVVSASANLAVKIDKSIVYPHFTDVEAMLLSHDAAEDAHAPAISKAIGEHDKDPKAHAAMTATIADTLKPTGDTDTVRNILSQLANRYKVGAGVNKWTDDPATTLAAVKTFMDKMASGSDVIWDGDKWHTPRTGAYGLRGQNGYWCFGPNHAKMIIQWGSGPVEHSKTFMEDRYGYTKALPIAFNMPIFACVKDRGNGAVPVSGQAQNTTVSAYAKVPDLYWDFIAIGF